MFSATDDKQTWRTWAKEMRAGLDTVQLSAQVCEHLTTWEAFQRADHILLYLAFGSEIDLAALHELDKTFYVTRTWFKPEPHLTVHSLDSELEQHPYGYWQPAKSSPVTDPKAIDLALVPGLAFDKEGTRLGYGMGFYDRLLPQLREDVLRVGISASALLVEALPKDAHDIPMTHSVTETGLLKPKTQAAQQD